MSRKGETVGEKYFVFKSSDLIQHDILILKCSSLTTLYMYTVLRKNQCLPKISKGYTKPLVAQFPNDKSNKSSEGIVAGTE